MQLRHTWEKKSEQKKKQICYASKHTSGKIKSNLTHSAKYTINIQKSASSKIETGDKKGAEYNDQMNTLYEHL